MKGVGKKAPSFQVLGDEKKKGGGGGVEKSYLENQKIGRVVL